MTLIRKDLLDQIRIKPGKRVRLKDFDPGWAQTQELKDLGKKAVKEQAEQILQSSRAELAEAQELLYAANSHAILVMLQAMDAAGKDGTIKHVMSGVNPQGCQVFSFKQSSAEELDHTFLWRYMKAVPERGRIGIRPSNLPRRQLPAPTFARTPPATCLPKKCKCVRTPLPEPMRPWGRPVRCG